MHHVQASHPPLVQTDPEHVAHTLADARAMLRAFFACYLEDREPTANELDSALRDGTRRAGEAVPLEELLAAYHEGGEALWSAAIAEARAHEHAELVDFARHLLHWQGLLARAAATSFVRELRHLDDGTQAARRLLAEALLHPADTDRVVPPPPPADLVERAEVRLPELADVLAYRMLDGDDPPGATAATVQRCLDERAGETVLTQIQADGAVVLLPADGKMTAEVAHQALEEALGMPLVGGAARATGREVIPAAAREATELLRLAVALGAGRGVYRRERLLLEHALAARPDAVRALAALLDPLERRPNLLTTLETWFAHDFDRRGTAEALAVHRNTLDYRLRRVGDLTELALDSARGLQTAGAALLARRLLAAGPEATG